MCGYRSLWIVIKIKNKRKKFQSGRYAIFKRVSGIYSTDPTADQSNVNLMPKAAVFWKTIIFYHQLNYN